MTAAEAAEVLDRVGGYEEQMTQRALGMTHMVWGLVSASIFLAYGTVADLIEPRGLEPLYSIVWIPFVAAGMAITASLWSAHSLSLHQRSDPKDLLRSLMSVVLFLAIAATMYFVLQAAGADWTASSLMALVNGVFALVMATRKRWLPAGAPRDLIVAGVAMAIGGTMLGLSGWDHSATTAAAAGLCGLAWFGAGIAAYRRG